MDRHEILDVKETLKENLSGEQIEVVLDELIHDPIKNLIKCTTLVEDMLSEAIALVAANQKRKLASIGGAALVSSLFSIIVSKNVEFRAYAIKELQLERSIYFHLFKIFNAALDGYIKYSLLFLEATKNKDMEKRHEYFDTMMAFYKTMRLKKNTPFQDLIKIRDDSYKAYRFRSMVTEKYIRFIHQRAIKFKRATSLNIDLDDLFKNMLVSVLTKAIPKYRSDKGPLTPHIEWLLKDAVTGQAVSHQYGVAYHIPTSARKKISGDGQLINNISSQIDAATLELEDPESLETEIEKKNGQHWIYKIAAEADKYRLGFLDYGFVYQLNADEVSLLKETLEANEILVKLDACLSKRPSKLSIEGL